MKSIAADDVYQSVEKVGSVNDILSQILVKLPIKSLIRYRLVSKQWLSLITSQGFCVVQNPTPKPAQGFFRGIRKPKSDMYEYEYVSLYPNSPGSFVPSLNLSFTTGTKISQSCNGLLLCYSLNEYPHPFYVYNPTTNVSTHIPTFHVRGYYPLGAALVFDPVKSPYVKVFLVMSTKKGDLVGSKQAWQVLIYSSETGRWKSRVSEDIVNWSRVDCDKGVYWNGCVHFPDFGFKSEILIFHVDSFVLRRMPVPLLPATAFASNPFYFGVSCDHLHLGQFTQLEHPTFDVYEMKRDYSGWYVKYRVDLSPFIAKYPEVNVNHFGLELGIYVLSLVRGESDDDFILVLRIPGKAVKINLVDGASEKLCDFPHDKIGWSDFRYNKYPFHDVYDYILSLFGV